jgi:branched-chain amino acid transport system substrate-binding protein
MRSIKTGALLGVAFAMGLLASPAFAAGPDCGLNTGKPAAGAPIQIGAIVTASGVADISSGAKGAKAYFDCVNANGGIHGRPIAYSIEDDQTRPDKAAELAKKLVEDKKVVALVGGSSLVDCIATSQYYLQSGVISLMAAGVAPQCFNATNIATLNAGPRYGLIGAAKFAVEKLGVKHLVCPQPSVPGADWSCAGVGAYAKLAGVNFSTFVYDQVSADNDSLIQQILATGGDSVVYNGSPPTFVAFLAAGERNDVGDKLKMLTPSPMYNAGMPKAVGSYWNDRLWVDIEFGPLDAEGPDTQNYRSVMTAYKTEFDSLGEGGYLAARMVVKSLLGLDPAKIDRASVTAAIQAIQNYKSDLLCADWSFGPKDAAARLGNRSGWIAQISNGGWKVNPGCVSTDESLISK